MSGGAHRKIYRALVCLLAAALATTASCKREPKADPNPASIVLISVDTLRRDHLNFYGYTKDTAPNMTRLAEAGVVFDQAIAAHVNTAPSHASMFTGLFPRAHGIVKNAYRLGDDARTLAEILTAAGYETAAFVSGFTLNGKVTDLDRGFQTYDDGGEGQRDRRGENTLEAALAWLRQRPKGNPIFLFFHLYDPHFPYYAPPPHPEGFRDPAKTDWQFPAYPNIKRLRSQGFEPGEAEEFVARYDGEIHYADMVVGRLLDALDASDIGKKSLVILTSDHGETLVERPYPLAHGARTFDEQIRIPLAIRFPEGRGKGRRIQSGAHHVDMAPTVLDFLGLKGPPSHGLSLLGAVDGKPPANPRPLFSMARPEPGRVANLREPVGRKGFVESVRLGGLKLISYPTATGTTVQLFDLTKDPQEKKDISIQSPDLVSRLEKELDAWRTSSGGTVDPPSPTLSDDTRDALRALGYLE